MVKGKSQVGRGSSIGTPKLNHAGRIGQRKPSNATSSDNSKAQPSGPARFQFEQPESITEQLPGSIQKSTQLSIREIRRSRSNHSSSSRQRLIEPEHFSSQNPWIQPTTSRAPRPQTSNPSQNLHKSVSAVSLATVKKLLKKDAQLPKHPINDPNLNSEQHVGRVLFNPLPNPRAIPVPRDFASTFTPNEIVLFPQQKHVRLSIVTKPESPMSIGGGILHGEVAIAIATDTMGHDSPLGIGYISVDLLGVEYCGKRHHVFQSLAIDLVDLRHPPPAQFVASSIPSDDGYWQFLPSIFSLSFELQLPEDPGPPPFKSRHGSIRYIVSTTAIVQNGTEEAFVRDTCEVCILGAHNPRTSLANLPLPLNAMETLIVSRDLPYQDITLRASLNRDVWASGMSVFVDVHIRNKSLRTVNKVTLSLERVMMVYHHSIAQLDQGLYRQSRLPDKIYRKTVARKAIAKSETSWRGIPPHSRESRIWMLNLPTGIATISTGKGRFFGVRYFLNVALHLAFGVRTLEAKLPVTILDSNSLDIISDPEIQLSKESHQRSSTVDSELPPKMLKQLRKVEQKTPLQDQSSRKRRETWAWVSELSPHPSLMPSPLLPSYSIPAKTGKTPSRLRMESRLSTPPVPHVPERLRPPLEEEEEPQMINRRYQIISSDKPRNALDTDKAAANASYDPIAAQGISLSALTNFHERLQHRSQRPPTRIGLQHPPSLETSQVHHRLTNDESTNVHPSDETDTKIRHILQDIEVVDVKDPNSATHLKKSPFKRRKPMPHRRAISRSKDVRSIYRLDDNSKGKDNSRNSERNTQDPDNGWETVENFF